MDTFGVPKKINRHVIKAVYELDDQGSDSSSLVNICNMVELSSRNNAPVANLLSVVRQSLLNLCKLGVIKKHGTKYYKCSKNVASLPHHSRKSVGSKKTEKAVLNEDKETLKPMNKKRRQQSEDSITDKLPSKNSRKRLRKRNIKPPNLPKVRKHAGLQLNYNAGEIDQDSGTSSDDEIENKSEDENENKTIFSSFNLKPEIQSEMFKMEMNEETRYDKISENSTNLLQSLEYSDQQEQNHELNNFDDQFIKMDVLNENESQLDEIKNVSELYKTVDDEETESYSKEVTKKISTSNESESTEKTSKHDLLDVCKSSSKE